ncbi:MAG: AraC family transcriptional regulator [Bacteroidia bacterium]
MPGKSLPVFKIKEFLHVEEGRDFYANTLPVHLSDHHFIHEPHKHDFFLVVLFTQGKGTHEIDFSTYPVKPGSLFLMSPGQTHNWKLSEDIDGYVFFHSAEFYELSFRTGKLKDYPFFASVYNSPLVHLNKKAGKKTEVFFQEILEEYRTDRPMKFRKISLLVDLLYIETARLYQAATREDQLSEKYAGKLMRLEDLVEKHFKKIKSPAWYAGQLNISEKHLNRICKLLVDKTTTDLISDRVLLEAKRMLVHSEHTIAEVAAELGYFDPSYFTRLFRKKEGETPMQFLKKYRSAVN